MASKRYRISFEIQVTDPDGSHPLDWIPEAVGEQIRDDEVVTGYLCEEIEDCDLDSEEKLWDNICSVQLERLRPSSTNKKQ